MKSLLFVFATLLNALCSLSLFSQDPPAIAPELSYASYLGGSSRDYAEDHAYAIALDSAGNIYVAGSTASATFPVTHVFGDTNATYRGFVVKLNSTGDKLLYSVLISGAPLYGIALDSNGSAYVIGEAFSAAIPVSAGAPQATFGGGSSDAFVAKINPAGTDLVYSTFLGGSDFEMGRSIALDQLGNVYVTGLTTSTNFPVTTGAAQLQLAGSYDAFVAKLNASGTEWSYATYLGGSNGEASASIAVDPQGRAWVAGRTFSTQFSGFSNPVRIGPGGKVDAFLARFSSSGSALEKLLLIGGSEDDSAAALALDSAGQPHLFGQTRSTDFPVSASALQKTKHDTSDNIDDFVLKLDSAGQTLQFSTYLGAGGSESLSDFRYIDNIHLNGEFILETTLFLENGGIAIDPAGNIFVCGRTTSEPGDVGNGFFESGLPSNLSHGSLDAYVAKINPAGSELSWLYYIGSSAEDLGRALALDANSNVFLTGTTSKAFVPPYFPATSNAVERYYAGSASDAFVAKLREAPLRPANDAFSERTHLSGAPSTVSESNLTASRETGEPPHAGNAGGHSVWWSWTAEKNGKLKLSTAGSTFDTVLGVYSGSSLAQLKEVAANDDEDNAQNVFTSALQLLVSAGAEYQIAVDGKDGAAGSISLSLSFYDLANDDFADAQRLDSFPITIEANNQTASTEAGEPLHAGSYGGASVWWEWTAPADGNVAVSTGGSSFDTLLAIYSGNSLRELEPIGSNNNYGDGAVTSQVTFKAKRTQTYKIAVDGTYGETGRIKLSLFPGDPPANDNFADATPLFGFTTNLVSSNVNGTREVGEPEAVFDYGSGNTVWWVWTAPTNGLVRMDTFGSSFDTRLAVFQGSAIASLNLIAKNDDRVVPGDDTSVVRFTAEANQRYYIWVDGRLEDPSGKLQLNLMLSRPPRILIESVKLQNGGLLEFHVEGQAGQSYFIESSPDLVQWTRLENDPVAGPNFGYSAAIAPGERRRFYRVVQATF